MADADPAADDGLVGRNHGPAADGVVEVHRHVLALCAVSGLEHLTTSHTLHGRVDGEVFSSGDEARAVISLQQTLGEGPTHTAVTRRTPVLVPDLANSHVTSPWVMFGGEALARGIRSVVALPLMAGSLEMGVATLHATRPVVIDAPLATTLRSIRRALTNALVADVGHPDGWSTGVDETYAVINQATGMVSVQLECDMDDALSRLRAHAVAAESSLALVAGQVVRRELRFSPDQAPRG